MERLTDKLVGILNEQDFCFAPDEMRAVEKALRRFKAYEDTGLEPGEFDSLCREMSDIRMALGYKTYSELRENYLGGVLDHLWELMQAERDGRLVVLDEKTLLAISAGARAIENNKRLAGTRYCWNVFGVNGEPKEVSYYEAANILRHLSEPLFDREEAEAALEAQKGGEGNG